MRTIGYNDGVRRRGVGIGCNSRNAAMMPPRVIMDHVFAEPFRPLRIHTATGRTYEVRHPEFVKMGRSTLTVYGPPQNDPSAPELWEEISLMLIESIAPLNAAAVSPEAH